MVQRSMGSPERPDLPTYDYSKIQGAPEVMMRVELLSERLAQNVKESEPCILEVGVGTGDITLMLARSYSQVTCIEMEDANCQLVQNRLREQYLRQFTFIRSKIEDAPLSNSGYDHILLMGVLEHLEDPLIALGRAASFLRPGGRVYILVNLANSLHRLLGVAMGIISHVEELSDSDFERGHHRIYTLEGLRREVSQAGLQVDYEYPFYLKPLPMSMLTPLPMAVHKGLLALGEKFPEFASYVYMEAIAPTNNSALDRS